MKLTLTATEWITVANLFDSAPAPRDARGRRLLDRFYEALCKLRVELRDSGADEEVEHEMPNAWAKLMRDYLSDRPGRGYHQAGWTQFIKPLLIDKLGWEEPVLDEDDEE